MEEPILKIHTRDIRFQRDDLIKMTLFEIAPYLVKNATIIFSAKTTTAEIVTVNKLMKIIKGLATAGVGWIKISFEEKEAITTFTFGPFRVTNVLRIKKTIEVKPEKPFKLKGIRQRV